MRPPSLKTGLQNHRSSTRHLTLRSSRPAPACGLRGRLSSNVRFREDLACFIWPLRVSLQHKFPPFFESQHVRAETQSPAGSSSRPATRCNAMQCWAGPSVRWRPANQCTFVMAARRSPSRAARPAAGSSPLVVLKQQEALGYLQFNILVQCSITPPSQPISSIERLRKAVRLAHTGRHGTEPTLSLSAKPRAAQVRNLTIRSTGPPPAAGELKRSASPNAVAAGRASNRTRIATLDVIHA